MNATRVIKAIDQANEAARQFHNAGKLDPEQEPFLLESFAIELARKRGTIPIVFASCGDEDGRGAEIVIVVNMW